MAQFEQHHNFEISDFLDTINPDEKSGEVITRLRDILQKKEGEESLHQMGELMFEAFAAPEYTAEMVFESLAEIYKEQKDQFEPQLSFDEFIGSFGSGLIKLCQLKLVEGNYDLGDYGPNSDGADGMMGSMTESALRDYYEKQQSISPYPLPSEEHTEVLADGERPLHSPEFVLEGIILDKYKERKTDFTSMNMKEKFGDSLEQVEPYITNIDPLTGQQLTFLGQPIRGGLSLLAIPFLKMAEAKIKALLPNYKLNEQLLGFRFRNMSIIGQGVAPLIDGRLNPNTPPSSHAFGLAVDLNYSTNRPKDGRGDHPDQVVMAMVDSGFASGLVKDKNHPKLGHDAMHYQLDTDLRTSEGLALANSHPVGKKYAEAVLPLLPS